MQETPSVSRSTEGVRTRGPPLSGQRAALERCAGRGHTRPHTRGLMAARRTARQAQE